MDEKTQRKTLIVLITTDYLFKCVCIYIQHTWNACARRTHRTFRSGIL